MKELSEYKIEIRRRMIEKGKKRALLRKEIVLSLSVFLFLSACVTFFLIPKSKNPVNDSISLSEQISIRYQNFSQEERKEFEQFANAGSGKLQFSNQTTPRNTVSFSYFDDPEGYIPGDATGYGKFGDCSVWFVPGLKYLQDVQNQGNGILINSNSFSVLVERNGEVTDLKSAYEKGWLTQDDLLELYVINTNMVQNCIDNMSKTEK